ncbi:MAG: agmatine deiminase family protein [Proteobacteria bacterium]|nr:agmatine deiminase family protein [Pseudomonadota bacterium]
MVLDGDLVAQNWKFDGYHDGRPRWMWADDNDNPDDVAAILDLPLERVAMVHERVVFVEGYHPLDVTRGHIDGLARFISEDEVVIPDDGTALYDTIADQVPDLTIHRLELVDGDPTLNWLVGDGFVLTGSTGDSSADAELAVDLGGYFPDRDIHFTDVGVVWENGGGVHCVTNDQPESR